MEPTGERFIPELMGGELIQAEHVARYELAAQAAVGRRVLDAGCGVGWGSALLLPGATSVTGLDLDPEAVRNATSRVPGAEFVVGDLTGLPWPDDSFDLVVCFEAIEHVAEPELVLDELVRVLAPGGLLMVSSPNPRVYPPNNPFHVRELTPEELTHEVGARLTYTSCWSQYVQIASTLVEAPDDRDRMRPAMVRFVGSLEDSDPYSLCIGSSEPLDRLDLTPVLVCAPSQQLVHLQEGSEALARDRAQFEEHLHDVRREREQILAEREQHVSALRDADAALRGFDSERAELAGRVAALTAEVEHLRRDREIARTDREHVAWQLLQTQQRLAATPPRAESLTTDAEDLEIDMLRQVVHNLHAEVDALRASTSWKVTRPLRALSQRLRRSGT